MKIVNYGVLLSRDLIIKYSSICQIMVKGRLDPLTAFLSKTSNTGKQKYETNNGYC